MSFTSVLGYIILVVITVCVVLGAVFAVTDRLDKKLKRVPPVSGGNPYDQFIPTAFINSTIRKKL